MQLTRYGGPLTGTPRWSPDGMNIAFDTRPEGQADIYVVSSIGGTPRRDDQVGVRGCSALVVGGWRVDLFRLEPYRRVAGLARAGGRRRGRAGHHGWRLCGLRIAGRPLSLLREGSSHGGPLAQAAAQAAPRSRC